MNADQLQAAYEAFFALLDAAPVREGSALPTERAKEWLETNLLPALARASAAEHHLKRLREEISKIERMRDERVLSLKSGPIPGGLSTATITTQVRFPVEPIAYEIEALLAAVRSSIDFTAQALAMFLKGVGRVRSVTTLRELAEKHASEPFAPLIKKWDPWIELLKDYRDKFTHYRTLRGESGYRITRKGDEVFATAIPFVIPERPPEKDVPDTRARRAENGDHSNGLVFTESTGEAHLPDGSRMLLHFAEEWAPATGFIEATDFCEKHLASLRQFIAEALHEMKATKFEMPSRPHGASKKRSK